MKRTTVLRRRTRLSSAGLLFVLIVPLLIVFLFATDQSSAKEAGEKIAGLQGTLNYLPALEYSPVAPVPAFVTTITLPDALCPNDVGANPVSGYVYVANHNSNNVSILDETSFVTNVTTGEWPTKVNSDPDSSKTFVTNLHGPTSIFQQTNLVASLITNPPPLYGEPYAAVYNPVNDYLYVTNILGSVVQVFDGTTSIANIPLTAGWILEAAVDSQTGLVYVPSWEVGNMYVIDGTQVSESFRLGWGPAATVVDSMTGYIYTAHSSPNSAYPYNLSVFRRGSQTVTPISTAYNSRSIALDPLSSYVYATNPDNDTVTVLQGTSVIANIPVGDRPWDVAVHPDTGYVFVTNLGSNNVTVLKNGALVTTLPAGDDPIAVGVDTVNNYVYVANESSEVECNDVGQCHTICNPPSVSVYR